KAWPVRSAQCRPPSPPPPASPPASKAAPRRADRRPSPSAGSPARPRNTTEKPSSPSPPRQPRPLPSSTHPPPESEDHDRFSSSSICHANFQSIALSGMRWTIDNPVGGGQDRMREGSPSRRVGLGMISPPSACEPSPKPAASGIVVGALAVAALALAPSLALAQAAGDRSDPG